MNLKDNKLSFQKIDRNNNQINQLVANIFYNEPFPIYEQNWPHIFSYASFQSIIYLVEYNDFNSICILRDEHIYLFSPYFKTIESLDSIVEFFRHNKYSFLEILNVSDDWLSNFDLINNKKYKIDIMPRSQNEVLYSVDLLSRLEGKHFNSLRQIRNKNLSNKLLSFKEINQENLKDCFYIIDKWNDIQGSKYQKNKVDKEKFITEKFLEFLNNNLLNDSNSFCKICYFNNKPVGYCLSFIHPTNPDYLICYTTKGINKLADNGIRGASDSLYLKIVDFCKNHNVKYINDGDLGVEEGSISHKKSFRPVDYLKSFDIKLYV